MKIDFYILEAASSHQALLTACELIEKAYASKQHVYVHTANQEQATRLDTLLWTYRDDSFIPHALYQNQDSDEIQAPIQIGCTNPPATQNQLLINITDSIPAFYTQFNYLIEIVFSDPHVQQLARERYKQYREQGHELSTHKLKVSQT